MSETLMEDTKMIHGVIFTIKVVADDDMPDLSWLGEFTDQRADEHGCGKRHVRNDRGGRNDYQFFCPSFGCDSRGWREIATDNGWDKDGFFEAARHDMMTALDWWSCGVIVTANLGPAGEAYASLWGLNWMTDEDYIVGDIVDECIREADIEAEHLLYRRLLGGRISAHSGLDFVNWEVPA